MTRRVLVTGAGGMLGSALVPAFGAAGWDVVACDRATLDVGDRGAVWAALHAARPDAVVNAAAYTAVDAAETDVDGAWRVNALAVRHLRAACAATGARLCHVSTDYVFDGTKPEPYHEWDACNPTSVYGASKRGGEQELAPDDLLVRTSWVFGPTGTNIVRTLVALAADPDRRLTFVDDQRGCPTYAPDLAATMVRLVAEGHTGTFHVTNAGPVTWFGLARSVLQLAGADPDRVRPVSTTELDPPRPARRPENSVLEGRALRLNDLPPLRHHAEALAEVVAGARH